MPPGFGTKAVGAAMGAAPGIMAGQPSMAVSGGINGFRAGGINPKAIGATGSLIQGAKAPTPAPAAPTPPANPTTNPIFAPSRQPQAPHQNPMQGVVSRFLGKSAAHPQASPAAILNALRAKSAQDLPEGVAEAPQYDGITTDAARAAAMLAGLGGVGGLGLGAAAGAVNAPPRHRTEGAFRGAVRAKDVMGGGALGAVAGGIGGLGLGGLMGADPAAAGNLGLGGAALGGLLGARAGWSKYDWENPQPTWER